MASAQRSVNSYLVDSFLWFSIKHICKLQLILDSSGLPVFGITFHSPFVDVRSQVVY